jgi:sorting nexin-5/6/32
MLAAADSIDDDLPIEDAEQSQNNQVDNLATKVADQNLDDRRIEIQITDAVSEKETIKFKIQVKTDLPSFVESRGHEFNVERTHHEFSWLHSSFSENPLYAGYLIPPKPQKPDFSTPSKQLHDISEKEKELPKEDMAFLKTDLEDKYLAQFKKAVSTHEIFLRRICQHKVLRNDHDLRIFLSYDGELNVRSKNAKERVTGWFKKGELVIQAVFNDRVKDPDAFFEKNRVFINEYELRIDNGKKKSKEVTKEYGLISKELMAIMSDIKKMTAYESRNPEARKIALDRCLNIVCRDLPKIQKWEGRMGSDSELKLVDLMRYYVAETESVKELLTRRQQSLDDLDRKIRDLEAAKIKNKNVQHFEQRKNNAYDHKEKLAKVGKEELVRFEENREEAFTKNLEEHAALQLKHSKQKINVLENMIKALESAEGEL